MMIDISSDINLLTKFNIFSKFPLDQLEHLLNCCGAYYKSYEKNEVIYFQGDEINFLCIIISGSVCIEKVDIFGNNAYILDFYLGNFFGEQMVLDTPSISPYTYKCSTKCKILCLPFHKKYSTNNCRNTCECRVLFRENLLNQIAKNNLLFIDKLEVLSKKNIREKIMTFLINESDKCNSNKVQIPFSKSKFADYLGVNRSSLMRELSNMKNDGLIELNNKTFTILK